MSAAAWCGPTTTTFHSPASRAGARLSDRARRWSAGAPPRGREPAPGRGGGGVEQADEPLAELGDGRHRRVVRHLHAIELLRRDGDHLAHVADDQPGRAVLARDDDDPRLVRGAARAPPE